MPYNARLTSRTQTIMPDPVSSAALSSSCSLARRFGAVLYDALLVLALMFAGTLPFIAMRGGEPVDAGDAGYQLTLAAIVWVFFCGFWGYSGRTLGMQSWGLRLEKPDGQLPGFMAVNARFFAAIVSWLPVALGFWWQLWDKDGLTWHDRLSGTRLRYYSRR